MKRYVFPTLFKTIAKPATLKKMARDVARELAKDGRDHRPELSSMLGELNIRLRQLGQEQISYTLN